MSRYKPSWILERDAKISKAIEEAQTVMDTYRPPKTGAIDSKAIIKIALAPSFGDDIYIVTASQKAVARFTAAKLNIITDVNNALFTGGINKPRGYKPYKVNLTVGGTPTRARAYDGKGRRYIKYSAATGGEAQANFSAPFALRKTAQDATLISPQVVINSLKTELTAAYSRLTISPEKFPASLV